MSITFDPTTRFYAVVEYLKSTKHIYDPVNHKPEQDSQYRLVCLAVNSDEAWRVDYILRALSDGRYWYTPFAWPSRKRLTVSLFLSLNLTFFDPSLVYHPALSTIS